MSTGLPHASPQKLFKCILYFLEKSGFSSVDEDFSQRPEQEPREKATEETESFSWKFKVLFYPRAHNRLLKWRSFRKLLEVKRRANIFFAALLCFSFKINKTETEQKEPPNSKPSFRGHPGCPKARLTLWPPSGGWAHPGVPGYAGSSSRATGGWHPDTVEGAGQKRTPYSESFQDPADKATSVSLPAAWQGGEGPPQKDEGQSSWRP